VDYVFVLFYVVLAAAVFAFIFRAQLRAWWIRRKLKALSVPTGSAEPPVLTTRLYELDKVFGPFGSDAAHPSALRAHAHFIEAARLLAAPGVSLAVVLQYVEGNSWSLASAALAALKQRKDGTEAIERVLTQCQHFAPWTMYFALDFLFDIAPHVPVGAPLIRTKDWWIESRWMPNIFRDYLARCAERGDVATFGAALRTTADASPHAVIRRFLAVVTHPFAETLSQELDAPTVHSADVTQKVTVLTSVGRFWPHEPGADILVEPDGWQSSFALAETAIGQRPPRSLLISGEPLVGKSSFLRLLAGRLRHEGWSVFEASGADLQAGQVYIGQLEGRIRQVVDELASTYRTIWYIPDIVQVAMSGRHHGQSATMLDQIVPAIAAGRLVVFGETTPKGLARLMQIRPSLRGVFETITIEPLPANETLALAEDVVAGMAKTTSLHFAPESAQVALDAAGQYLSGSGMPGSALLMLKLTALRATDAEGSIGPRHILQTLSQLSGLPVSILDTREQLDLKSVRNFFAARVIGQDEAVEAIVGRIAMLKAGLNDPNKPIGVFLFAGPTGTGKTELAKAVSEFLFGSVERMIRLDMSEFQTHDSIGKILGQASAFADADSLINRVRKQPFSVLLLDEFEKSHPMIWDLFLQAFDEGRLTDAMGQVADLRHCLIILTSNLGATAHRSLGLGLAPQADEFTKEQVLRAIAQTYRPEFRNRLDKVIVFAPLTRDRMRAILQKELTALRERRGLKDRTWAVEWESSALEFLLERGFSPEMGARPLKRAIDQYVVAPLAAMIVERRFPEGDQFLFVRSDGEGIQVEFVDPDADANDKLIAASVAEPITHSALASAILAPQGTPDEFQMLEAECATVERKLSAPECIDLKDGLTAEMSSGDFWNRPDRFAVLARFALMDRVKAAAETAHALRDRARRYSQSPRRYSGELNGRFALQLYLIREGIRDAFNDAPVEVALAIEPVLDGAGDRPATLTWCSDLTAMYRAWAEKRRMQIRDLPSANASRAAEDPILLVSGFGAHRVLAAEAGLHVFEPSEGGTSRVAARVRVDAVPLGQLSAAEERGAILATLNTAPRSNSVVRRYRKQPPLVRDAAGQWRTGRLDLVLGGAFDLLQDVAG
jgi:ATP-dependent Clp protease ATP-binding subunit ClpC